MEPLKKRPREKRVVSYDFAPELASGETITNYDAKAFDGVTDVSSDIILTTDLSGTIVKATVRNGTVGKVYQIRFEITTSTNQEIDSYPDVTLEII
jgi:hypothetical protein